MSRSKAKENFTVSEFEKQMEGIYTTSVGVILWMNVRWHIRVGVTTKSTSFFQGAGHQKHANMH